MNLRLENYLRPRLNPKAAITFSFLYVFQTEEGHCFRDNLNPHLTSARKVGQGHALTGGTLLTIKGFHF